MQILHTECKRKAHAIAPIPFDRSYVFQCAECGQFPWSDRDERGRLAADEDVKVLK